MVSLSIVIPEAFHFLIFNMWYPNRRPGQRICKWKS